jgi:hypothetical protein
MSLLVAFSFFTSYFTPELIHSAAHYISRTDHVSDFRYVEKDSAFSNHATEHCSFDAILGAHTGHSAFTPSSAFVSFIGDFEALFVSTVSSVTSSLARLPHQARGPPSALRA